MKTDSLSTYPLLVHPKVPQKTTTFERQAKWAWKSDSLSLDYVMFLTWWCSLCASEWGLTNGCGHSSIDCNQQSIWHITVTYMYSHNFLNVTLYLDLLLVAGSHPFKDKISLLLLLLDPASEASGVLPNLYYFQPVHPKVPQKTTTFDRRA